MTNQDKIRYLKRYRRLDAQINQLLLEKQEIRALGTKTTPTYSDMPNGTKGNDKIPSVVEKLEQQQVKITKKIDEFIEAKQDIERALHTVKDDTLRLLLRYRYINGLTWESIAVTMHYTYQWVCKLHGKALELIRVDSN